MGLTFHFRVGVVEGRHMLEGADDGPGDEVCVADLGFAVEFTPLIEQAAVFVDNLDGDGALRGRRGDAEGEVHVLGDAKGRALERDKLLAGGESERWGGDGGGLRRGNGLGFRRLRGSNFLGDEGRGGLLDRGFGRLRRAGVEALFPAFVDAAFIVDVLLVDFFFQPAIDTDALLGFRWHGGGSGADPLREGAPRVTPV